MAHWKGVPISQKTAAPVTGDSLRHAFISSAAISSALAYSRHCPGPGPERTAVMAPSLWGLYLVVRQGAQAVGVRLPGG